MDIICQACGAKLGTVEYRRPISLAEAQARASAYRCGKCADKARTAEQATREDRQAAVDRLLADADKATTVAALRTVIKEMITTVVK